MLVGSMNLVGAWTASDDGWSREMILSVGLSCEEDD